MWLHPEFDKQNCHYVAMLERSSACLNRTVVIMLVSFMSRDAFWHETSDLIVMFFIVRLRYELNHAYPCMDEGMMRDTYDTPLVFVVFKLRTPTVVVPSGGVYPRLRIAFFPAPRHLTTFHQSLVEVSFFSFSSTRVSLALTKWWNMSCLLGSVINTSRGLFF